MVSLEVLFCTLIIDAREGCNLSTVDVPGAYLHAEIPKDKRILINNRGGFVDSMCQVNHEYIQHARYENRQKTLHILVLREVHDFI